MQIVDKTNGFRRFGESFDQTFSKVCEVEGAEPSSKYAKHTGSCLQLLSPAEVERILGVFFLITFSFAPLVSKEKVANKFVQFNNLYSFGLHSQFPPNTFCVRGHAFIRSTPLYERFRAEAFPPFWAKRHNN